METEMQTPMEKETHGETDKGRKRYSPQGTLAELGHRCMLQGSRLVFGRPWFYLPEVVLLSG
jgi:hypothetical protein